MRLRPLFCVLLFAGSFAVLFAGCPSKNDRPVAVNPLKNNASKIAYDAVPAGFEKDADYLLSRELVEVISGSGPAKVDRFEIVQNPALISATTLTASSIPTS